MDSGISSLRITKTDLYVTEKTEESPLANNNNPSKRTNMNDLISSFNHLSIIMPCKNNTKFPPLPPPEHRLAELQTFTEVLSDQFIDYNHLDVYDSIFRHRVDEILDAIKFDEDSQHIEEFGEYIRATNSTKCRDFLKFFMMILQYFGKGTH
jgi:hypothetical protein